MPSLLNILHLQEEIYAAEYLSISWTHLFVLKLLPAEVASHRNIWMRRAQKPKYLFYPCLPGRLSPACLRLTLFFSFGGGWAVWCWCMMHDACVRREVSMVQLVSGISKVTSSITQSCLSFILLSPPVEFVFLLCCREMLPASPRGPDSLHPVSLSFFNTNLQNRMGVKRSWILIEWFICKLITMEWFWKCVG